MDYKDYQKGATQDFFWFRAKKGLIDILLRKLKNKKKLKILNIGAGTGDDLPIISQFGDVHVIDLDCDALELIQDKYIFEKKLCDARNIIYPDNCFDLVVAFDVLEHIEDDALAINEIHRVLKPKGFFVFTVPAFSCLYSSHDKNLHHIRRYNKATIKNRLIRFKCLTLGYWVCTLFMPIAVYRILRKNDVKQDTTFVTLPTLVNSFFYILLKFENWCIKHCIYFPFGITLYGIYQKKI